MSLPTTGNVFIDLVMYFVAFFLASSVVYFGAVVGMHCAFKMLGINQNQSKGE